MPVPIETPGGKAQALMNLTYLWWSTRLVWDQERGLARPSLLSFPTKTRRVCPCFSSEGWDTSMGSSV